MKRVRYALLLLLALCGAARAGIVMGVEAQAFGFDVAAEQGFGAPVTRVYGHASVNSIPTGFAIVDTANHGCTQLCGALPGAHAIAELDMGRARWRVHTSAGSPDSRAAAGFRVTDQIPTSRAAPGLQMIDFNFRVEFDHILASRGFSGADAHAAFTYSVYIGNGNVETDIPLLELRAFVDDVDEQVTREFSVAAAGQPPMVSSDIPSAFEVSFSALWSGGPGSPDLPLFITGNATGSSDGGTSIVSSYNSSWLGIRVGGQVAESRSGYGYIGFVPGNLPVPEPSGPALVVAAIALAACATCRPRRS